MPRVGVDIVAADARLKLQLQCVVAAAAVVVVSAAAWLLLVISSRPTMRRLYQSTKSALTARRLSFEWRRTIPFAHGGIRLVVRSLPEEVSRPSLLDKCDGWIDCVAYKLGNANIARRELKGQT